MTDLSVIIPIYNTPEEELRRVFSSLSGLSGFSWEAVLIDDGSAPPVGAICREQAEQDSRFRYFYKENGGVSSARNMGIEKATGTYITFVDADDELLAQAITPRLLQQELVIFDIELDGHSWHALQQQEGALTPWQLHRQLTVSKALNSPCAKLFLRSIIAQHGLQFNTDYITAEDWSFVWDYCSHITGAAYVRQCCYRYYRDPGSGNGRLRRQPERMLQNLMGVFDKKAGLLPRLYPGEDCSSALLQAAAITAEDLFNSAADLYTTKLLSKQYKAMLREFMRTVLQQYPALPGKARLKAWVIAYCWPLLSPLALARRQHLKRQ